MSEAAQSKKRPTLSQVVFRIDFSTKLLQFNESLPTALLDVSKRHFPIQEPKKAGVLLTASFSNQAPSPPPTVEPSVVWQFLGRNREKVLTAAPDHINIVVREYPGFAAFRAQALEIVEALGESMPHATIRRMGLRYINLLGGLGDAFDWKDDIQAPFRVGVDIASSPSEVLRAWNTFVMMRGDLRMTVLYGIRNPDYPAPVVKRQYILDFDAQQLGQSEVREVAPFLDNAHKEIKRLYESSVTPGRRAQIGDV